MAPKQIRYRKIIVCTACHRKKSKCDRGKPCSACIKSGIADSCVYDGKDTRLVKTSSGDGKVSADDLKALIDIVNGINKSLKRTSSLVSNSPTLSQDMETFNIRRAVDTNKSGEYKVFHWRGSVPLITMAYADPASELIRKYVLQELRPQWQETSMYFEGLNYVGETMETLMQRCQSYFGPKFITELSQRPTPSEVLKVQTALSSFGADIGLTFLEDSTWRTEPIIHQVQRFLPSFTCIQNIVKLFFHKKFLGSEFIIEEEFQTELKKLYIYDEVSEDMQFTISSKIHLATVAILLLIMRISYLSLKGPFATSDRGDCDYNEEMSWFVNNSVPIDVAELLGKLLNRLNITTDMHIMVFQAFIFQFVYELSSPEDETYNDSTDPGISFARIVSLAKSLNLNQDVIYCQRWGESGSKSSISNYRRKVWIHLNSLAVFVCSLFNNSLEIHSSDSNLLLPQMEFDTKECDKGLITATIKAAPVIHQAQVICERTFPLNTFMPTSELVESLKDLELMVENTLGNLEQYFRPASEMEASVNLYNFQLLIKLKCLILCYHYSLYVYYETKGDMEFSSFYARKFITITYVDFCGLQKDLLPRCEKYFGLGSWLHLTALFTTASKLQLASSRIRVRYFCSITFMTRHSLDKEKIAIMKSILLMLRRRENLCIKFAYSLSKAQAGAWWWYKACVHGIKLVERMEKDPEYEFPDDTCLKYSTEEFKKWENCLTQAEQLFNSCAKMFGNEVVDDGLMSQDLLQLMQMKQLDGMWKAVKFLKKYYLDRCFEFSIRGNIDDAPFELSQAELDFDLGQYFPDIYYI